MKRECTQRGNGDGGVWASRGWVTVLGEGEARQWQVSLCHRLEDNRILFR